MFPLSLRPKFLQAVQAEPSQGTQPWKGKRLGKKFHSDLPSFLAWFPEKLWLCGPQEVKMKRNPYPGQHSLQSSPRWGGGSALDKVPETMWEPGWGNWCGLCASCNPCLPGLQAARAWLPALAWRVGLAAPRIRQGRWNLGTWSLSSEPTPEGKLSIYLGMKNTEDVYQGHVHLYPVSNLSKNVKH